MKYIKTFEDNNNGQYWLIPTDDRFEKSLTDLNVFPGFKDMCLKNYRIPKNYYIFVGYDKSKPTDKWGWCKYEKNLKSEYYESVNLKYMGTVNIPDYELEMKISAEKYNI